MVQTRTGYASMLEEIEGGHKEAKKNEGEQNGTEQFDPERETMLLAYGIRYSYLNFDVT